MIEAKQVSERSEFLLSIKFREYRRKPKAGVSGRAFAFLLHEQKEHRKLDAKIMERIFKYARFLDYARNDGIFYFLRSV